MLSKVFCIVIFAVFQFNGIALMNNSTENPILLNTTSNRIPSTKESSTTYNEDYETRILSSEVSPSSNDTKNEDPTKLGSKKSTNNDTDVYHPKSYIETTSSTTVPSTTAPSTTAPSTTAPSTTKTSAITTPSTTETSAITTSTSNTILTSTIPASTTRAPLLPCHRFDGPSFIGGIVLTVGIVAIGWVAHKFYKARNERNYQTL